MTRKALLTTLAMAIAMWTTPTFAETIYDVTTEDYSEKADQLEYCFVENFLVKSKGVFKTHPGDNAPGWDIYWQQAHAMDVLVYAYERIKDTNSSKAREYKTYMSRWYSNHANNWGSSNSFENPFTDDMCWIGLTLTHMYYAVDIKAYMTSAKNIYDNYIATRKQTDGRGTFLPWNSYGEANSGPNACTLSPACLLAARLYLYTGDQKYLDDAILYYNFLVKNICFSDGRVEDPPLTYTQGTFAEACRQLYHITGEKEYKTKAQLYIRYVLTSGNRCTDRGLLRHEGTSMDQSLFKAVFVPYAVNYTLDETFTETTRKQMAKFLLKNADALWDNLDHDAYPQMYCPYYWGDKFDNSEQPLMGAMASGASLLENVARMNLSLQAVAAIDEVEAEPEGNGCVYNIAGQKVDNDYKGIIIRNGKKYLQR